MQRFPSLRLAGAVVAILLGGPALIAQQSPGGQQPREDPGTAEQQSQDGFRFRTGVELVNVTATVTDESGRFVPNLRKEDFIVYEDGKEQPITHFNAERVPVSLGIALDTSGSMAGEKFQHAQAALDRFLYELLAEEDEVFLYRFSNAAYLEQGWTTEKNRISRALRRITPRGGTAMYDAIAEAVPLADQGTNRKKALLVISDGNDTNSESHISEVKQLIRQSEVLVYAIGIDGQAETGVFQRPLPPRPPTQRPFPWPVPRRRPWPSFPMSESGAGQWGGSSRQGTWQRQDDRVNAAALRAMTDDSGGRTEIVRDTRDLGPATQGIADELSQQYFFAYPAAAKRDGQWHEIRVELRDSRYRVRARRGYTAT